MLEFLHLLTANNRIVFSSVNNNGEFIASLCYHLLIMTGATLPEYSNHDDGHDSEYAAGSVQMFDTDLAVTREYYISHSEVDEWTGDEY